MNIQTDTRVLGFIHHLREQGYSVGIKETTDILDCFNSDTIVGKSWARDIIRSLSCQNKNDWQRFDELFLEYWYPPHENFKRDIIPENYRRRPASNISGIGGSTQEVPDKLGNDTGLKGSGAGRQKTISKADFRFLNDPKAMQEVEELAEMLAHNLKQKLSRRMMIRNHGIRFAMRQTIRKNISYGGMPVHPAYKLRRQLPIHLVILHDVSHSMSWNNPLLFRFVRGIIKTFKNSEAFAFHTKLFRVSDYYRERSLEKMKEKLEQKNHLWMGGTCIAESIERFNSDYAKKYLKPGSIVLIISDGFDTNEPALLVRQLQSINRKTRSIFWLNPMLGREGYNPDKDTIRAALPYIHQHVSANNLNSLKTTLDSISKLA